MTKASSSPTPSVEPKIGDEGWICLKGEHEGAIFEVMTGGAIKIEVNGSVHVRTPREWHALAVRSFAPSAAVPTEPTEEMADAARGVLQILRGKKGASMFDCYEHCRNRGDDVRKWPQWAKDYTGYVTEQAAAMLIYELMAAKAPIAQSATVETLRQAIADSAEAWDDVAECVELDKSQRGFAAQQRDYLRGILGSSPVRCAAQGHVWVGIGDDGKVVCDDCGIDKHATTDRTAVCKATPYSYGGGASCDQKWDCEQCGDVTDTHHCPLNRTRSNDILRSPK